VFAEHTVLQFNCTNTLKEQVLERVSVHVDTTRVKGVTVQTVIAAPRLVDQQPGVCYVCIKRPPKTYPTGSLSAKLKFLVKEVDPSTGDAEETGYDDEYKLEDIELLTADYMRKSYISNFSEGWEKLGNAGEVIETYKLTSVKTTQDAIKAIIEFLGMQPCDQSDTIPAGKSNRHILYLAGKFLGDFNVLVRGRMMLSDPSQGVSLELTVRSTDKEISSIVTLAI